jgi:hypothetical protein
MGVAVAALTVERVRHSGAIMVTGLVDDGAGAYYLTRTYYGYTLAEARRLYRDYCQEYGLRIERGY